MAFPNLGTAPLMPHYSVSSETGQCDVMTKERGEGVKKNLNHTNTTIRRNNYYCKSLLWRNEEIALKWEL